MPRKIEALITTPEATPEHDEGLVVYDTENHAFYSSSSETGWTKQLRKARIYYSKKYARQIVNSYPDRKLTVRAIELTLKD